MFRMFSKNLYCRREAESERVELGGGTKSAELEPGLAMPIRNHKYFTCKTKAICRNFRWGREDYHYLSQVRRQIHAKT